MPELKYIPLDRIRVNPMALRDSNRQSDQFIELVGSIKRDGVLNAINVRRKPDADGKEFELVDGLQRYSASQEAGTGTVEGGNPIYDLGDDGQPRKDEAGRPVGVIPAQIVTREDADALTSQIIANAHRIETKPVEYATALMRYLGYNPMLTESELAAKLNKSPAWIGKMLGLIKLHDKIKPIVDEGKIPIANAAVLAKMPPDEQLNWLERAQTTDANQFSVAALARVKEIRDAKRQGRAAAEEGFIPVPHLRKKLEIEAEMNSPSVLPEMIREAGITKSIKPNHEGLVQAAILGAQFGLKWSMNMDEKSLAEAKKRDDERKAREAEQKARREQERAETKQKEASERAAKAREDAQKARESLQPQPA